MIKVRCILSLFYLSILAGQSVVGQEQSFDEQQFFKQMKESYYSLAATDKNNFTVLLTNERTEKFAKENWKNPEIFPIQLIWLSPDRLFLSEQGVPALSDSLQVTYQLMIKDLKALITGVMHDLKRFYINGLYESISEDYKIRNVEDLVEITFNNVAPDDTTYHTYYFGKNGLCLKTVAENPILNSKVETYPQFKIVKTKWLVTGWEIQMSKNNKIESGLVIRQNNKLVNDEWVPGEMYIAVQQSARVGETFTDVVKFRNLIFNQSLQYIERPK